MNFGFTEEQEMIRKSARDFVKGSTSFERLRKLHDDEKGFGPDLYKSMADAGWLGTVYPEDFGGIGLGFVDLLCIQEELGRGLITEPLLTSSILAGGCVWHSGDDARKRDLIPRIASGETLLSAAAYELAGRHDFGHVATTAAPSGAGYALNGSKCFVPDAGVADAIVVPARTSGATADRDGITLFLVPRDTPGLKLTPVSTMDRRRRFTLDLTDAKVPKESIVGAVGDGHAILDKAIDRATVALCAEMLGGMDAALEISVAYSKERVQFGKPIGSFQAIKHKAANMFVAIETARSATYYATMAVDEGRDDLRSAVSCAKALCSDAYLHVGKDAIQIHGGIGFTDECDVQFYYKRAVVTAQTFGDATWHRDRYATEKGF